MRPECSASPWVWPPQQSQINKSYLTPLSPCIFNLSLQLYVYFISIFTSLGLFHVTSIWLNISLADKANIAHFKKSLLSNASSFLENLHGGETTELNSYFTFSGSSKYPLWQSSSSKRRAIFFFLPRFKWNFTLGSKACSLNMKESIAFFWKSIGIFRQALKEMDRDWRTFIWCHQKWLSL